VFHPIRPDLQSARGGLQREDHVAHESLRGVAVLDDASRVQLAGAGQRQRALALDGLVRGQLQNDPVRLDLDGLPDADDIDANVARKTHRLDLRAGVIGQRLGIACGKRRHGPDRQLDRRLRSAGIGRDEEDFGLTVAGRRGGCSAQ